MSRKLDRQLFVSTGAVGGAQTGYTKRRGDSAYYKALSAKGAAARKANKIKRQQEKEST